MKILRANLQKLCCLLAVAASFFSTGGAAHAQAIPPVYTAVIDAGSSGTRLFFYKVTPGPYAQIEMLIDNFERKVQPNGKKEDGINNFVCNNPDYAPPATVVPQVIDPLLQELSSKIANISPPVPADRVIVNLFATAGMRTAQALCGKAAVNRLYDFIRAGVRTKGFSVGEVRTTNGNAEEGVWTWANLNDVYFNVFKTATPPVGNFEVGGSSAQIAYPSRQQPNPDQNVYEVRINNRKYNVFSRTYLGLGLDDARKYVRETQAPQNCWATGFPYQWDLGESDPRYPKLKVNGGYNLYSKPCSTLFNGTISTILAKNGAPNLADTTANFVGVSGAYFTLKDFGAVNAPSQLMRKLNLCHTYKSWPNIETDDFAQFACPNGTYLNTVLFDPTTGIFRSQPSRLIKALPDQDPKTDATRLTWTRGFLLIKYSQ